MCQLPERLKLCETFETVWNCLNVFHIERFNECETRFNSEWSFHLWEAKLKIYKRINVDGFNFWCRLFQCVDYNNLALLVCMYLIILPCNGFRNKSLICMSLYIVTCFQLPYYIDGDIKLTQSNAILRYIARKHNLCKCLSHTVTHPSLHVNTWKGY